MNFWFLGACSFVNWYGGTVAVLLQACPSKGYCVASAIPERPWQMLSQASGRERPTGATRPRPLTTILSFPYMAASPNEKQGLGNAPGLALEQESDRSIASQDRTTTSQIL